MVAVQERREQINFLFSCPGNQNSTSLIFLEVYSFVTTVPVIVSKIYCYRIENNKAIKNK